MKATNLTPEESRDAIVTAAEDKKANYLTVIDLRGKTLIADFFIICSGTSNIHIRSVADGIMEAMENFGIRQRRIEGYSEASWILLDYGDAIVHIMSEEQRGFYKLESLWTGKDTAKTIAAVRDGENPDNEEDDEIDAEDAEDTDGEELDLDETEDEDVSDEHQAGDEDDDEDNDDAPKTEQPS